MTVLRLLVAGLFLAALMAAIMSSIDSGIHSVTTAVVVDFRDRLFPNLRPKSAASSLPRRSTSDLTDARTPEFLASNDRKANRRRNGSDHDDNRSVLLYP